MPLGYCWFLTGGATATEKLEQTGAAPKLSKQCSRIICRSFLRRSSNLQRNGASIQKLAPMVLQTLPSALRRHSCRYIGRGHQHRRNHRPPRQKRNVVAGRTGRTPTWPRPRWSRWHLAVTKWITLILNRNSDMVFPLPLASQFPFSQGSHQKQTWTRLFSHANLSCEPSSPS